MNAITTLFKKPATTAVADVTPLEASRSLEELIAELTPWGKVRLGQYGSGDVGWHCAVNVHVAPAGTSFEVRSSFDHPTPTLAATECVERLRAALASLRVKNG